MGNRITVGSCCRLFGVITGLCVGAIYYESIPRPDPIRLEDWNKVQPRIKQADDTTKKIVSASTNKVYAFFESRMSNADKFAEEVFSWSGKWALMKSYLQEGGHDAFIREAFERHIFDSEELKAMVESAAAQYVSEIQGQENELLVAIRADLEGSEVAGPGYLPSLESEAEFRRQYAAMLNEVLPLIQKELGVTITREIVSFVVSDIATALILDIGASLSAELGVSGGILGVGASSGLVTFGVGIVVGFIVDRAINWAMREAGYNPELELAEKVRSSLQKIRNAILSGDGKTVKKYRRAKFYSNWSWSSQDRDSSWAEVQKLESEGGLGLSHQLNHINDIRSRVREEALKSLILKGSAQ